MRCEIFFGGICKVVLQAEGGSGVYVNCLASLKYDGDQRKSMHEQTVETG